MTASMLALWISKAPLLCALFLVLLITAIMYLPFLLRSGRDLVRAHSWTCYCITLPKYDVRAYARVNALGQWQARLASDAHWRTLASDKCSLSLHPEHLEASHVDLFFPVHGCVRGLEAHVVSHIVVSGHWIEECAAFVRCRCCTQKVEPALAV